MGYNLHITRAASWLESEDVPIRQSEWEEVADDDPSFNRGGEIRWDDQGVQREYVILGIRAVFSWNLGRVDIWGDFPGQLYEVAVRVAGRLNAHVAGDEHEYYRTDGTSFEAM